MNNQIVIRDEADQLLSLMESAWQCRPEVLQKIGALTLAWAVLDNALEPAIWMLSEIDITNIKHDSVSGGSETRLRLFGEAAKRFPEAASGKSLLCSDGVGRCQPSLISRSHPQGIVDISSDDRQPI